MSFAEVVRPPGGFLDLVCAASDCGVGVRVGGLVSMKPLSNLCIRRRVFLAVYSHLAGRELSAAEDSLWRDELIRKELFYLFLAVC